MRYYHLAILIILAAGENSFGLEWNAGLTEVKQNNSKINSAKNLLQSFKYQEKGADNLFLPKVTASVGT